MREPADDIPVYVHESESRLHRFDLLVLPLAYLPPTVSQGEKSEGNPT